MLQFRSPDNQNPFNLDLIQPIQCLFNDEVVAVLRNSDDMLQDMVEKLIEDKKDDFEFREKNADLLEQLNLHEGSFETDEDILDDNGFGSPFEPCDWQLVGRFETKKEDFHNASAYDKNHHLRLSICQAFMASHAVYLQILNWDERK